MSFRVIVPVLNEALQLPDFIQHHAGILAPGHLIFVDGNSSDDSREIIEAAGYRCVTSMRAGRSAQMNLGATIAEEDYLVFLHADTRLPADFNALFEKWAESRPAWGYFSLRLTGRNPLFRVMERLISLRSRLGGAVTGDQTQVIRADLFEKLGGYAPVPLMEDLIMCRKLRRQARPRRFPQPVISSSRRWEERGMVRTVLLMWWLRLRFRLGADPRQLARIYR